MQLHTFARYIKGTTQMLHTLYRASACAYVEKEELERIKGEKYIKMGTYDANNKLTTTATTPYKFKTKLKKNKTKQQQQQQRQRQQRLPNTITVLCPKRRIVKRWRANNVDLHRLKLYVRINCLMLSNNIYANVNTHMIRTSKERLACLTILSE